MWTNYIGIDMEWGTAGDFKRWSPNR